MIWPQHYGAPISQEENLIHNLQAQGKSQIEGQKVDRFIKNDNHITRTDGKWLTVLNQLSFAGFRKKAIYETFDGMYGKANWLPAHFMEGKVISRYEAYLIYEEAYYQYLKSDPEIREWIVRTASEVYDIQPSNIGSGFDYTIQECGATHLQDISVRRVLTRLKLEEKGMAYSSEALPVIPIFEGDHPVQIRGVESEGYVLNPGQVPFHKPDAIIQSDQSGWWDPGSAEDWYQKNKVLLINPEVFQVSLVMVGPTELYFAFDKRDHYSLPHKFGDRLPGTLRYVKGKRARSLWCENKALTKLVNSPRLSYTEWEDLVPKLRLSETVSKRGMRFSDLKDD